MVTLSSAAQVCAGYSILGFVILLYYGILLINDYRYVEVEDK